MHALEIIGLVFTVSVVGVILAHYAQNKLFGDKGSATTTPSNNQVCAWAAKSAGHGYIKRLLCALDMFVNAIFDGNLDETISSRTSRWVRCNTPEFCLWRWISTWIIWLCDLVEASHGIKAESGDMIRAIEVLNLERKDLGLPPVKLPGLP